MAYVIPRENGILHIAWIGVDGEELRETTKLKDTKANRKLAQARADRKEQEALAVRSGDKEAVKPDVTIREGGKLLLDSLPGDYASKRDLEARLRLCVYPHIGNRMSRSIVGADVLRVVNATTLGDLRPEDIKLTIKVRNAAAKLEAQKRELAKRIPNAEASPQQRQHIRIAIQKLFTHLIEMEQIVSGKNPAEGIPKITGGKRKKLFLPWRLTERLLAHVPKDYLDIFRFALGTGIRKGESLPLRWTDLLIDGEDLPTEWVGLLEADDFEGAEAMPEGGYAFISKSHLRDGTKGKKDRVVPIPEWLAAELRLKRRFSMSQLVFPDKEGEQRKRWVPLHDIMRTAMKAAGLVSGFEFRCVNRGKSIRSCGFVEVRPHSSEDRTCPGCKKASLHIEPIPLPHTFRHLRTSYAMELLRRTGSIATVAQALGNTERVASEHYAGLLPQQLLREANKMLLGDGRIGRNLEGPDAKSGQIRGRHEEGPPGDN